MRRVCCVAGGGWRCLAKALGLSEISIAKIDELYKERTEQVIQRWERRHGRKMPVSVLLDALHHMNRPHLAVELLERWLGECIMTIFLVVHVISLFIPASTHINTQSTSSSGV